jgi:tetratricopeptide (TPR) repeat protein
MRGHVQSIALDDAPGDVSTTSSLARAMRSVTMSGMRACLEDRSERGRNALRSAFAGCACIAWLLSSAACDGATKVAAPSGDRVAAAKAAPSDTGTGDGDEPKADPAALSAAQKLDSALNAANMALKAGQFAACRKEIEAYLARAGASAHVAHAEFLLGLSYHRQRLYGEARPHFERAIALEPGYIPTYYFYGFCLFNLGALDEAEKAFATYLKLKPDEADAIFGQGLVALEQDRVDEAERRMQRAIELAEKKRAQTNNGAEARKDLARYESRLSDVYLRRDDLVRARAALEKAVELWPDFFESWNKLYKVLTRLGENAAAEKALTKYQELFERQSNARGAGR